jgi:hypothetical protein
MRSVAWFALCWLISSVVGYGLACLILPRVFRADRLLLMPVVGVCYLVLASSLCSYAGLAMSTAAVPIVVVGAGSSLAGVLSTRRAGADMFAGWRTALFAHGVSWIGAAAVLTGVALYQSWDPYNDTFAYISVADYLQSHPFFAHADVSAAQPVLTQIALYERTGLRMGATFLLALVTALFRAEFSFDLFLPVVAWGVAIAPPGLWVLCRRGLMLRRSEAGLATAIYALHTAIPITNALWGFLAETFGLALLFPLLAAYLRILGAGGWFRRVTTAGLLAGALALTYVEITPFAAAGLLFCSVGRLAKGRLRMFDACVAGLGSLVIAAAVAPVAAASAVHVLGRQAAMLAGWDVHLSLFDYVGMLAGYRSLSQQILLVPGLRHGLVRIAAVSCVATTAYAMFRLRERTRWTVAGLGAPFVLALAWYALFVTNPWNPLEYGQPWSTFKLVTYVFFVFATLWAIGLTSLWKSQGLLRLLAAGQLAGFFAFFPLATVATARERAQLMAAYTGRRTDPIVEYKRLPALLPDVPPGTPVNLVVPTSRSEHRQLVAYFLRRPVVADWTDDVYIGPELEIAPLGSPTPAAPVTLVYAESNATAVAANLVLRRGDPVVQTVFGRGWREMQRNDSDWWRWLDNRGELEVKVPGGGTLILHADIAIRGSAPSTMRLEVGSPSVSTQLYVLTAQAFAPFESHPIHLGPGWQTVTIGCDAAGHSLKTTIGVRNLHWTFTAD